MHPLAASLWLINQSTDGSISLYAGVFSLNIACSARCRWNIELYYIPPANTSLLTMLWSMSRNQQMEVFKAAIRQISDCCVLFASDPAGREFHRGCTGGGGNVGYLRRKPADLWSNTNISEISTASTCVPWSQSIEWGHWVFAQRQNALANHYICI